MANLSISGFLTCMFDSMAFLALEVLPTSPTDQDGNHVLGCMPCIFRACMLYAMHISCIDSMHGDCKAAVLVVGANAPDVAMHAATPTPVHCDSGLKGLTCMLE